MSHLLPFSLLWDTLQGLVQPGTFRTPSVAEEIQWLQLFYLNIKPKWLLKEA